MRGALAMPSSSCRCSLSMVVVWLVLPLRSEEIALRAFMWSRDWPVKRLQDLPTHSQNSPRSLCSPFVCGPRSSPQDLEAVERTEGRDESHDQPGNCSGADSPFDCGGSTILGSCLFDVSNMFIKQSILLVHAVAHEGGSISVLL